MNQQTIASTNPRVRREMPSNDNPMNRKKPDPALLRLLRGVILIVSGAIALVGLLLLILPMFRVKEIKVEGNSYYTSQQIIEASGLKVGQEVLALDTETGIDSIYENCKYVKSARILRTPFSVRIEVTEFDTVMYTEFNGKYYSLSRDFRVLQESADAAAFADFLPVELPEIAALAVGAELRFSNPDADLSYINELIDVLEKNGTLASVTSLDVSQKYSVSYVMDNTCRVEFGKVGDTAVKLSLIGEILSRKGGIGETLAVIDVSDPQKPTYRPLGSTEVLLGN